MLLGIEVHWVNMNWNDSKSTITVNSAHNRSIGGITRRNQKSHQNVYWGEVKSIGSIVTQSNNSDTE